VSGELIAGFMGGNLADLVIAAYQRMLATSKAMRAP
jgi:hypothetical protein